MKKLLTEKDIIKSGGTHYIDPNYQTKFIDLIIGEHKKLRFYNCGDAFNVFLCEIENDTSSIQLMLIKSKSKFKEVLDLLYDNEGVKLYNELKKICQ